MTARYTASDLYLSTTKKNWHDARADCRSMNKDLVDITNAQEVAIAQTLASATPNGNTWIGLNDFTVEHQWDWPDSCSSNSFTRWAPGEPNNLGNEDCVEMYANGMWNDFSCAAVRQFLCVQSLPSCPTQAPTSAPTQAPVGCQCFSAPDILACPLVLSIYGAPSSGNYILWNFLALFYKAMFLLTLRCLFRCKTVDLGLRNFLCLNFVKTTRIILGCANALLILLTYLFRCIPPIWVIFFLLFLHIDSFVCIAEKILSRERKAPPKPPQATASLEILAFTNTKRGWKENVFNTVTLKAAKKETKQNAKAKRKSLKDGERRKISIKAKGFSLKGTGMI
ncbi:hypothetical protein ScalyP_jg8565 [Parmales sp. scaly parma]|nr:hypothetical protein ScalyP_jg8565 [Parmales sp. scaly parma]